MNEHKESAKRAEEFIKYIRNIEGFYAMVNMTEGHIIVAKTSDKSVIDILDKYHKSGCHIQGYGAIRCDFLMLNIEYVADLTKTIKAFAQEVIKDLGPLVKQN